MDNHINKKLHIDILNIIINRSLINLIYLVIAFSILISTQSFAQKQNSTDNTDQNKNVSQIKESRNFEILAMISSWKENSILQRNDNAEFKIDTLNTVGRFGIQQHFWSRHLWIYYGFVIGQSKNSSAVDDIYYYQRSVVLTGGELNIGVPLISSSTSELSLVLGGISRTIKHSVPTEDYQFLTATKSLIMASFHLSWMLSDSISWQQSIGTQGRPLDTLWSAGFGYKF